MDRHPLERYEGSWWLPDTPERRIGGVLELGTEHQLKIFGDLAEKPRLSDPPAIHGECMNRTVTLLQPELRGGRSVVGREGIATYFSPTALIGRNPVAPERTRFDVLSCELNHFATWTARSGIQSRLDDPPAASYTFPDELIAECDDFTLRVSTLFKQAPYDRELNWTEVERIYAYTNEPMPLERLTHAIVRPLQHMLALATGRVCETTRLRVAQSDHAGSHEKLWFDVVYYKGRYGSEDAPEAKRHEFLFTLADIKFADFMPRWFGLVERVGLPCDILFSLGRRGNDFVSNRLFNVAAAAEGMHRRLHPELEEQTEESRARVKRISDAVDDPIDRDWLKQRLANSHLPTFASRLNQLVDQAGGHVCSVLREPAAVGEGD